MRKRNIWKSRDKVGVVQQLFDKYKVVELVLSHDDVRTVTRYMRDTVRESHNSSDMIVMQFMSLPRPKESASLPGINLIRITTLLDVSAVSDDDRERVGLSHDECEAQYVDFVNALEDI